MIIRLHPWVAFVSTAAFVIVSGRTAAADIVWTADLGTTGIGVHLTLPIAPDYGLEARVGTDYLNEYKFKKNTAQIAYDFKASLRTVDVLLDWHPMHTGFRVTGGLVYNNNIIDGIGVANRVATFSSENGTYSTTQIGRLIGRIDFQRVAPYLGIGWRLPDTGRGWSASSDFGVMYQGSPRTRLAYGGCTLPGTGCALVANALTPLLEAEARRVNQELRTYRFFPVIRVGISYRF